MKCLPELVWPALVTACLTLFSLGVSADGHIGASEEGFKFGERSVFSDRAVEARIETDASVCLQGEACAGGVASDEATLAAAPAARTAEEIYNTKCMSCHVAGVAGAPLFGDVVAWTARLNDKGLDQLVVNAIKGINAMPAMGLCMDCSEEDVRITVEYMVNAAK